MLIVKIYFNFDYLKCTSSELQCYPNSAEERLLSYIFDGYNSLIRPVLNASSPPIEVHKFYYSNLKFFFFNFQVFFSLAFVLLINVDEKNQIMQTNVWPTMKWNDYQMQWDPREFDGIKTIRVPPDKVWLPDIVLFNK